MDETSGLEVEPRTRALVRNTRKYCLSKKYTFK
jgi:hypothetical protein